MMVMMPSTVRLAGLAYVLAVAPLAAFAQDGDRIVAAGRQTSVAVQHEGTVVVNLAQVDGASPIPRAAATTAFRSTPMKQRPAACLDSSGWDTHQVR